MDCPSELHRCIFLSFFFFFNDTATTEIYTLSLHDALPIYAERRNEQRVQQAVRRACADARELVSERRIDDCSYDRGDRKSTRLNSSHANISYAVFCLKKKNKYRNVLDTWNR